MFVLGSTRSLMFDGAVRCLEAQLLFVWGFYRFKGLGVYGVWDFGVLWEFFEALKFAEFWGFVKDLWGLGGRRRNRMLWRLQGVLNAKKRLGELGCGAEIRSWRDEVRISGMGLLFAFIRTLFAEPLFVAFIFLLQLFFSFYFQILLLVRLLRMLKRFEWRWCVGV